MNETVFTNARLITPDAVVEGTLVVRDGRIVSLDNGASSLAERIDLEGDYLMPGLVELHTDNLEKHFIPRPKVLWPQGVPAFSPMTPRSSRPGSRPFLMPCPWASTTTKAVSPCSARP